MGKQHTAVVNGCITLMSAYGIFCQPQNTGGAYFKGKGGRNQFVSFGRNGTPDIIGAMPPDGRFIGVEVKIGRDKQSDAQLLWQADFEKVGGMYVVVRDLLVFKNWLATWKFTGGESLSRAAPPFFASGHSSR